MFTYINIPETICLPLVHRRMNPGPSEDLKVQLNPIFSSLMWCLTKTKTISALRQPSSAHDIKHFQVYYKDIALKWQTVCKYHMADSMIQFMVHRHDVSLQYLSTSDDWQTVCKVNSKYIIQVSQMPCTSQ